VCLCGLSTAIAYWLAAKYANEACDLNLLNSADSIVARLSRNENGVVVADLPPAAQAVLRHYGEDKFYYQIVDSSGHRLTGDALLPPPRFTHRTGPAFRDSMVAGQRVRMCRIPVRLPPLSNEIWVQVAETLNSRRRLLQQIFLSILVPQVALVLLASLSVYLGVRRGLLPLTDLGALLTSRSELDLSPVELKNTPGELTPVIRALNRLFDSTSKHIRSQRQFIGNAAHQLRTPVTALRTYLDYAERINESPAVASVLKQTNEATGRTVHLITRLLSLARAEGHNQKVFETIDLGAAVDSAAAGLVHQALNKQIELQLDTPEMPVAIRANKADLEELITNLLENAIKFTPPEGSVWVRIAQADRPTLVVEDNGPGIKDEEKTRVFERFYRGSASGDTGCGLGLSIVSEIVNSNKATLELSDRPGGGTTVRVSFEPSDAGDGRNIGTAGSSRLA